MDNRRQMQWTVQLKVVTTAVVAMTVLVLGLGYFYGQQISWTARAASDKRALSIATGLANECEYGLLVGNKPLLASAVNKVLAQADVASAVVFNSAGKVMAAAGPVDLDRENRQGPALLTRYELGGNTTEILPVTGTEVDIFYVPVKVQPAAPEMDWNGEEVGGAAQRGRQRLGLIAMTFTHASMQDAVRRARQQAWLIAALMVLAVALPCALIARHMVRPLHDLVAGTERLAAGQLGVHVVPSSSDEIGELARAFNKMAQALDRSHAQLIDYQENLQRRILEATVELRAANDRLTQEIQERNRSEQALQASETKYRTLFDTMAEGFALHEIICDDTGTPCDYRFLEVNPAFEQITGLKKSATVGRRVLEVLPQTEPFWITTYGRVALTGEPSRFEHYSEALGKHFEVIAFSPHPGQFATTFFDVTDRKLLQEQLLQAQKMDAIGRLAGGVAHDFNNLLTTITGYSELLLRHLPADRELRHHAEQIERAAYRAARLTRQLLAFSRKQILQPRVIDLNHIVTDIDSMLRRLIGEHIDLVTACAPGLWRVKADLGQIEQVILTLAINARDAMPTGGELRIEPQNVTIDAATTPQADGLQPGQYVCLRLTDTGSGMTDDVKAHMFEPFFTTKPTGKGTGLGLATCYGIIKQSGGYITVASEPGAGSAFAIYLPRIDEPVGEPNRRDDSSTILPGGTETILIVEDEPAVLGLAATVLTQLGYTVLQAGNGVEALRLVRERNGHGVDLVLTDVVMPQMGGKDLADTLRVEYPAVKVLFASGYTEDAIVHHGVIDPNVAFIEKPYTPGALARKVREVLDA